MIAEIRLENFKRFRALTLNAANLTVLTGANGAGKTSVLHSLLLARQMAKQPGRGHVELNGVDTLELGGPEDVIHREAGDDLAAVEVLDAKGIRRRWSFRAPSTDKRTLNAIVVDRPDGYSGALAEPAPQFTALLKQVWVELEPIRRGHEARLTAKGQLGTDPWIPLPGRAKRAVACCDVERRSYGPTGVSTRYARPALRSGPSDDTPTVPPLRQQLWALRPGLDGGVPAVDDFTPDARRAVGAWA